LTDDQKTALVSIILVVAVILIGIVIGIILDQLFISQSFRLVR